MRKRSLLFLLAFSFLLHPIRSHAQAADIDDSLAMVDLYNSTNGPGWINHTNWLTTAPLSTWFGLFMQGTLIAEIVLQNNNLKGTLPASMSTLTKSADPNEIQGMLLSGNHLTGPVPLSWNNFSGVIMDLSFNELSGSTPPFSNYVNGTLQLENNHFTFTGLEGVFPAIITGRSNYFIQADIPLIIDGNTLSVNAGGTLKNNSYRWYLDGNPIATRSGDSTFPMTTPGVYSVQVTNTTVPGLTLFSISSVIKQDSLALVDLYNATGGSQWTNHTNWLTTAPEDTWYGLVVRNGKVMSINLSGNNLTGTLPSSIGNFSGLTKLDLSNNQIGGTQPIEIANATSLTNINLGHNLFGGPLPSWLGVAQARNVILSGNQFSGNIPSSVANYRGISELDLSNNKLTGTIPLSLGGTNLGTLDLSGNQLTGKIPDTLGSCELLEFLTLNDNQLTDSIPSVLLRCPSLVKLYLRNNQLTGPIPDTIFNLFWLQLVDLSGNRLTGRIPDSLGPNFKMVALYLQNNQLTGPVPMGFKTKKLDSFDIHGNHFTFNGMENLPLSTWFPSIYAPQANIPLHQQGDSLYVSAGGALASETFALYKDGVLAATQSADSVFIISSTGKYNIVTTDSDFPLLTLLSDTVGANLVLPHATVTNTVTISGTAPSDINSGIFQLASITPSAVPNALSGDVTALVTIDPAVSTFNGQPYVQRHYDITPANNAATAQATVTLYFSQQDFDAYNNYVTTNNLSIPLSPTNGLNNGNVRITQYHGNFSGAPQPANYSQGSVELIPLVAWDAANAWWTVTFPVSGFSGFFLSSGSSPLPLTLLQFTGALQGSAVSLQWKTTSEINTSQFVIERSGDGSTFNPIGAVTAHSSSGTNNYGFVDNNPLRDNNFYRLKIVDRDGVSTYSPVVLVRSDAPGSVYLVYPNPARSMASVLFNFGNIGKYSLQITDGSGRKWRSITGAAINGWNKVDIDLHDYAAGIYIITLIDEKQIQHSVTLRKE